MDYNSLRAAKKIDTLQTTCIMYLLIFYNRPTIKYLSLDIQNTPADVKPKVANVEESSPTLEMMSREKRHTLTATPQTPSKPQCGMVTTS